MRSFIMGEFTEKAKAAGNDLAGKVKEGIGAATDNKKLEAEGKAQQVKADVQRAAGEVKGELGDKI
jgi:uncharacterized protein YjbJ (UPF0337 family)